MDGRTYYKVISDTEEKAIDMSELKRGDICYYEDIVNGKLIEQSLYMRVIKEVYQRESDGMDTIDVDYMELTEDGWKFKALSKDGQA